MSLGVPDVRVRLTAEGEAQVVAALRKVVSESQRTGAASARSFGQFNTALAGTRRLLQQVAAAAGIGALVALAKQGSEAADQVGKMSQRVGASVRNLSALGFAAKTADVDLETLGKALVFLNRRTVEFQAGSKDAARDFKALGLQVRDFEGKDAAERFDLIAKAFARLEDSPEKTALGFRVFGRQVAAVIPLLNELGGEGGLDGAIRKAREFGVLLSEDTARATQAINDDFTIIKEQVIAGAARFVEGLAPAVHAVLGDVQDTLGDNQDAWKEWGKVVGQTIGFVVLTVSQLVDNVVTGFRQLFAALDVRLELDPRKTIANFRAAADEIKRLEDEAEVREAERRQRFLLLAEPGRFAAVRRGVVEAPVVEDADAKRERDAEAKRRAAEAKRLAAERERARVAAEKARFDQQSLTAETALAELADRRAQVEQLVSAGLLTQEEGAQRVRAAQEEMLPVLREILRSFVLVAAANPFDQEAQQRALEFAAALREVETDVAAVDDLVGQLRTTAKDAFREGLVNALTDAVREGQRLLDVVRNIGLALLQAVQQALTLRLATSLANAVFPTPHAMGGPVEGPGTGTSDSVPAMLSRGEYVVRAAVVQQPGMLEALEAVNQGLAAPVLNGPRGVRRFADGGFVSGAGVGGPAQTSVAIGLEEGLVVRHLESPAGERAVVRVLAKNPRAAGSALRKG